MASSLLVLAVIVAAVVGSVALLGWLALWLFGSVHPRLPRLLWRRPAAAEQRPVHRPLQDVAADLRRLSRQLGRVPAGAPMARRRGLQAAYDDVLIEAAGQLELPTTLGGEVPGVARDVERLRLEAVLEDAGLALRG